MFSYFINIIFTASFFYFLLLNMYSYRRRSRWPYRSWRRSSVTRQQQSGRRYFNISFPVENIVSLTVSANQAFSNVLRTSPYVSPVGTSDTDANRALNCAGVVGSIAYRKYCQLYDQVKINSVSFSVSIADTIGAGGIPGVRVYTSWDRDMQMGESLMTADELINGPESQVVTFINNSRAKFYRYNRASDLQERTTFIDSSNQFNANLNWVNLQWGQGNGNRGVGYVPSMSMVVQTSNTTTSNRTITVQVQARYNVTFRNPKYGLSVDSSSKGVGDDEVEKKVESEMEEEKPVLKKKKVVVVEPENDEDDELNPLLDESVDEQEPVTFVKPVSVKKAGKKS